MYATVDSVFKKDGYGEIKGFPGGKTILFSLEDFSLSEAKAILPSLEEVYETYKNDMAKKNGIDPNSPPKRRGGLLGFFGGGSNGTKVKFENFAFATKSKQNYHIIHSGHRHHLEKGGYKSYYQLVKR